MAQESAASDVHESSMSELQKIIGVFVDEEACAQGIENLRRADLGRLRVFSPIPSHRLEHALALKRSPVRAWVLAGGISGIITGFALTIGTSYTYPHYVGGKPLASIPAYVIIAFELMVLFGALSGVLGFLIHSRLPRFEGVEGFQDRFGRDRFGVMVACDPANAERVEAILKEAGAEEVSREGA